MTFRDLSGAITGPECPRPRKLPLFYSSLVSADRFSVFPSPTRSFKHVNKGPNIKYKAWGRSIRKLRPAKEGSGGQRRTRHTVMDEVDVHLSKERKTTNLNK